MRQFAGVLALILMLAASTTSHVAGAGDLPSTFSECILAGGQVRIAGAEVSCRLVKEFDFRIYYSATTECDEEIELEHWGHTREGVMTYPLEPGRTIELPGDTREMEEIQTGTPYPCLP